MRKVFLLFLGVLLASVLYAGKPQKEQQQRAQPTPTPTPSAQRQAKVHRVLSQQGREAAPTPEPQGHQDGDDPAKSGRALTFGRDHLGAREVAPTMTPNAEHANSAHASEKATGAAPGTPTPDTAKKETPAPKVDSINLNSSRSNAYRSRPTATPTPGRKSTR